MRSWGLGVPVLRRIVAHVGPAQCREPGVKAWGCAGCGLKIRHTATLCCCLSCLQAIAAWPSVGLGWGDTGDCGTTTWDDGSPHAGRPAEGQRGDSEQSLQELLGTDTSALD